ncbi:hypothetical protein PF005_g9279 [Phytophthora fragariae]|uniref:Reverse transcriptase/retrotransposon-derived protein RNase H-like domain-containing protein n=1 Tax=Phytophthora fragariae TaxID=53985 RepID=A0A6A3SIC7_9STRA|nr:hypothetical protein PF003_g31228 [Phytophthora fragariae]KAE8939826.1 hypothetical protein PF009_g10355 [Phytophthora fragariae]KAE9117217.1 hypothetical protein PF007_g9374 [Phytophthora fragariae]KAE9146642.1 hypothetical protein PF006_g8618 [Phytophthora fragariae]KAE9215871.1 hypothetical protein PF005_g9279 [Phytophthora fragariae]
MVSYYRDMWPRRAHILAPLTALMSPQDKYQWTDTQQKAFDQMKAVMAHTVELAFPTYGDPFHIYTDASGYQLGAVITQYGRPLAFWSKKCNESQRKHPANGLELLSILLLLREYRTMRFGQELHIHTDHLNLNYGPFNNIQMMRWRLEIEEFGPTSRVKPTLSWTLCPVCLVYRAPTWGRVKLLPKWAQLKSTMRCYSL